MFKEQNVLIQDNVKVSRLIYIPKQNKKMVLETCYDEKGHIERNKLTEQVGKSFYWDDLRKDYKRYVETCQ
jgi:Integrase zinc binding domain